MNIAFYFRFSKLNRKNIYFLRYCTFLANTSVCILYILLFQGFWSYSSTGKIICFKKHLGLRYTKTNILLAQIKYIHALLVLRAWIRFPRGQTEVEYSSPGGVSPRTSRLARLMSQQIEKLHIMHITLHFRVACNPYFFVFPAIFCSKFCIHIVSFSVSSRRGRGAEGLVAKDSGNSNLSYVECLCSRTRTQNYVTYM